MAAESYRFPPEKQPADRLGIDEQGRQVLVGEHDPTAGVIARNPDGTETLRNRSRLASYPTPLVPVPGRSISSGRAMKLAIKGLLETLVAYQIDARAQVDGAPAGVRPFAFQRVFLSSPRATDEADPAPSVILRRAGPVAYSDRQRSPRFVDGTRGRWAPNTALRKVAIATGRVQIMAWCADTEQQEALEAAIEDAFLAEPSQDLVGRRIVVPQYFDQQARLTLVDSDDEVDETMVRENRWPLVATVQVEIDRVILVSTPPSMETLVGADVGGEITIE